MTNKELADIVNEVGVKTFLAFEQMMVASEPPEVTDRVAEAIMAERIGELWPSGLR